MSTSRITTALVVLLLVSATLGFAQQGTAGLQGRIVDSSGGALPGVSVVLRGQETGLFRDTVSGADGTFSFPAMTPGVYVLEATLTAFRTSVSLMSVSRSGKRH